MKKVLLLPFLLLALAACEKTTGFTPPDINYTDSIDLDGDLQYDFVVGYICLVTTDSPSSEQVYGGELRPLEGRQFLYRNGAGVLFLEEGDTLRKQDNTNATWSHYPAPLIRAGCTLKDGCDEEWTILSATDSSFFVGVLLPGEPEQIGWLRPAFNTITGEISIQDKGLSSAEELIIPAGTGEGQ